MRKAYIFVYSPLLGTQAELIACLNQIPGLLWRSDIPNSFYLASEKSAQELSDKIHECRGKTGRFIIAEVTTANKQGWLTPGSWHLLNTLTYEPKS